MSVSEKAPAILRDLPFVVTPKQLHKYVGLTAIGLPILLIVVQFHPRICSMTSISHFYYTPVGGDILVGGLTVIAAIMLSFYRYKGDDDDENSAYNLRNARLAKLAGLCALGVAFVPTSGMGCFYDGEASRFFVKGTGLTVPEGATQSIYAKGAAATGALSFEFWALLGVGGTFGWLLSSIHYLSAAAMFSILGYFSFFVFTRVQTVAALADAEEAAEGQALGDAKIMRNRIYHVAGVLIFLSIVALVGKFGLELMLSDERILTFKTWWNGLYLTFVFEAMGLIAFGVSWLVKARIFGWLEDS